MGAGHTATVAQQVRANETRQAIALNNGGSTRQIEEDHFGGYAGGMMRQIMREGGHSPRDWGMSKACANMVRKSRMHRMGISHAKI